MEIIQSLSPDPSLWRIVLISPRKDRIIMHLEPLKREARCSVCGTLSQRIHSHYLGQPWDLVWSGWPIQLYIVTRRFFCDCLDCPRIIFSEPFPKILKYYAHRTTRLQAALLEMAHIGSAEGAARLAKTLGYVTCGESLRQLQRQELMLFPEPRVIGLDEFALYKTPQISYGTIIVDMARHRPIDVLSGDQTELVAAWLNRHPGIEIITRDRDQAYIAAASAAVPGAMQVADRYHLVENVIETLKKFFQSGSWQMPSAEPAQVSVTELPNVKSTSSPRIPQLTTNKLAKWEAVKKGKAAGQSIATIACELGLDRRTVRKYLALNRPPVYHPPLHLNKVTTPFLSYLRKRWEEGCHDGRRLYEEIVKLGYRGKQRRVYKAVEPWRQGKRTALPQPPPPLLRWLLRSQDKLEAEEKENLEKILLLNPSLAKGYHLKENFREIFRQRDVNGFTEWLKTVSNCGLQFFTGIAGSIQRDIEAVKNALILPWSNAQCEGQICRLKLIKRAGYGRAKPDLLRQRVLHRITPIPQLRC